MTRASKTKPRTVTVADLHALADRLERKQIQLGDHEFAAKALRTLLTDRPAAAVFDVYGQES